MTKKPQKSDDEKQRLKIEKEIENDEILRLHFQYYTLREIATKVKLSHMTVKNRLDKMIKELGNKREETIEFSRNIRIAELETLKKKAWEFINSKKGSGFAFKYMEIILKTNQEISKLNNEYPIPKATKTATLEEILEELDSGNKSVSDAENED